MYKKWERNQKNVYLSCFMYFLDNKSKSGIKLSNWAVKSNEKKQKQGLKVDCLGSTPKCGTQI